MTGTLKLIEKSAALQGIKGRLEVANWPPKRPRKEGCEYGPCLLVSNETGSEGSQVARLAGARLGWPVFDRELVDQIAQHAHVRQELIESVDEHTRSKWQEVLYALLQSDEVSADTYLYHLQQILMALGHHGDAVIVGRGAQFTLPAVGSLRVRVVAPFELRVQRVAKRAGLTPEDALLRVRTRDNSRADFIRKTFHRDIRSPLNYDLVVNTGEMNVELATRIVLAALHEKLGV